VGWDHVLRMRSEYPRLTRERLTVDAMETVDGNLGRVRSFLRPW
jgi:hypothetical protein